MKRLSVIVPIYNVEAYLGRCLRSLEDQDIPKDDYEIICINDGSTDKSRNVAVLFQNEFDNIILIDQRNQGVSAARNKGISIARGEYLIMVDPDDFIKSNVFEERLNFLFNSNIDVGFNGHSVLDENLKEEYRFDPFFDKARIMTGIDFTYGYFRNRSDLRVPHSSVGFFFKASFLRLHQLAYLKDVPYLEDGQIMVKINCLAERVVLFSDPIYMITIRSGSATNSRLYFSEFARQGFLKAAYDLVQFQEYKCSTDIQKIFINQPIIQFTIVYLISHEGFAYLENYPKLYNVLKKGPLRNLQTEGCNKFYRKMGNSYNKSIHYFYMTWTFYKVHKSLTTRFRKLIRRIY